MRDLYELQISLRDNDNSLHVDHRFASVPDIDTVVALRDETERWFIRLYSCGADRAAVSIVRLDAEEETIPAVESAQNTSNN